MGADITFGGRCEKHLAVKPCQQCADEQIHSCSYFCDLPACIKEQRDELRDRYSRYLGDPPHTPRLLQDDSWGLSRWLSDTPNARQDVRDAAEKITKGKS